MTLIYKPSEVHSSFRLLHTPLEARPHKQPASTYIFESPRTSVNFYIHDTAEAYALFLA